MIFGDIDTIVDDKEGDSWFAWYPILLADGRFAWLEDVCREQWQCGGHSGYSYYLVKGDK